MTDLGISIFASLGVAAQILCLALIAGLIAAAASRSARATLAAPFELIGRAGGWLAWGVAAASTAGSLFMSEVADFVPCRLCWQERGFMYPLVFLLIVVAILRFWWLTWAAMIVPIIGAGISVRHVWVEIFPESESAQCRAGIPCSFKWIEEFGYVTIPVLALTAFVLITLLLAITGLYEFRNRTRRRSDGLGAYYVREDAPPAP